MRKKFSPKLFKQNDKIAREKIRDIITDWYPYQVKDNTAKYGVDLLVIDSINEHICNIEVEVKKVWIGDFPYEDVNFPERKAKYAKLKQKTYFVMFNSDLSQYLVVKGKDLLDSPCEIVPNKYCKYGEKFFKVPLSKVSFNKIVL